MCYVYIVELYLFFPIFLSFLFLAFIYATAALGPVVGYALGALLLQFYVDLFSYNVSLTPSDPRWIGAWWGGFIICGVVLILMSLPFFAFPKVLSREKRKILENKSKELLLNEEDQVANKEYGRTIKGKLLIFTAL